MRFAPRLSIMQGIKSLSQVEPHTQASSSCRLSIMQTGPARVQMFRPSLTIPCSTHHHSAPYLTHGFPLAHELGWVGHGSFGSHSLVMALECSGRISVLSSYNTFFFSFPLFFPSPGLIFFISSSERQSYSLASQTSWPEAKGAKEGGSEGLSPPFD